MIQSFLFNRCLETQKMKKTLLYIVFIIALALTACATPTPAPTPTSAPKPIVVENAWGRPSPAVAEAGAIYMTIRNTTAKADKLTQASSEACGMVELHETVMQAGGVMGMQPVKGGVIEVPANGSVELKPGGFHIMCMMKSVEFKAGNDVHFVLTFANAGEITIHADIKDQ